MESPHLPRITARPGSKRDLPACFRLDPPHFGEEVAGVDRALAVWSRLAGAPAFHLAVFELDGPSGGRHLSAFLARLFVSRDFVEAELATPRPGLLGRLIEAEEAGRPVMLSDLQIRHGNAHEGLDALIVVGFDYRTLAGDLHNLATSLVSAEFVAQHAGYWLRRLVMEVANEDDRKGCAETGVFRIVDFPASAVRKQGERGASACALATIGRGEVLQVTAHPLIPLFLPKNPRLRLRESEQGFLKVAAEGLTDEEISRALGMSVSGVKKRWLAMYERIGANHGDFFPAEAHADGKTRGRQKRHLLLSYVRAHPEELTPFEW